jgi:hypothetical protein
LVLQVKASGRAADVIGMLPDDPAPYGQALEAEVLERRRQLVWSSPAIGVWLTGGALQAAGGPARVLGDLLSVLGLVGTIVSVYLWWAYCQVSRATRRLQPAYDRGGPRRPTSGRGS